MTGLAKKLEQLKRTTRLVNEPRFLETPRSFDNTIYARFRFGKRG